MNILLIVEGKVDEPTLFAEKIHAILCRKYKRRVKGVVTTTIFSMWARVPKST